MNKRPNSIKPIPEQRPKDEHNISCVFSLKPTFASSVACGSKEKRRDIQGLRTFAIVAVVLFHLWPKVFRHGYLGVDMFFVISGYLMTQILTQNVGPFKLSGIAHFYRRRIHRIVPIYLFMLCAVLGIGQAILVDTHFDDLQLDAVWALGFVYNVKTVMHKEGYFMEEAIWRFLLHTWSLAVEMQFYLLAPFIICFLNSKLKTAKRILVVCVVAMALSRLIQLLVHQTIAFGTVPPRLWQFFAGITACFFGRRTLEEKNECFLQPFIEKFNQVFSKRLQCYFAISVLCATLFLPVLNIPFPAVFQFTVVILTALLLNCEVRPWVITNRVMVETGDLSYVWYLVHWPFIQLVKYRMSLTVNTGIGGGLAFIGLTLGLAFIVDRVIDRSIRRIKQIRTVALVIGLLYFFCGLLLCPPWLMAKPDPLDDPSLQIFQGEFVPAAQYGNRFLADLDQNRLNLTRLTRPEKIAINRRLFGVTKEYIEQSGKMIRPDNSAVAAQWTYLFEQDKLLQKETNGESVSPRDKWDFRASFKGKGNLSVVLAGNSHADQIANELALTWSDRFSTLDVFTMGVCLPLDLQYGWPRYNEKLCLSYSKAIIKLVKELRPDVLFLNFYYDMMGHPPVTEPYETDPIFASLQAGLDQLQPFVGKIFVGAPNLAFDNLIVAVEVEKRLWWGEGNRVRELNQPYQYHVQRTAAHWERLRHVKCEKCVIVDWTESFCDGKEGEKKMCSAVEAESQLANFIDDNHYSFLGYRKSIQAITDIDGYEIKFSPDGQWLLFQSPFLDWNRDYWNQIFAINLNDDPLSIRGHRQIRCVSNGVGEYIHPSFYPDSHRLIFSSNFHNQSVWAKELETKFNRDLAQNSFVDNPETAWCSHSPYRVQCYALYDKWTFRIAKKNVDAVWLRPLSPDMDLFRMDLFGNVEAQLTNETGFDGYGTVSPDGRWIVYTSMKTGDPELWIMNAVDGSEKRQLLCRKGFEGSASFSFDGKSLIFVATPTPKTVEEEEIYEQRLRGHYYDSRHTSLYIMDVETGNYTQILIDAKSAGIKSIFYMEPFDVKKMTHFTSPKFMASGKIMFHACYDTDSAGICASKMLFISNADGTEIEKVRVDGSPDVAVAVLNNAETQIAFQSRLREYEKSTHRLRTLFVANWKYNKTVLGLRNKNDHGDALMDTVYAGSSFSGEKFLNNIQQLTFGGTNLAPKFRVTYKSAKITANEPYPFGQTFGSTHSLAVLPVLLSTPYYIYSYEPYYRYLERDNNCSQNDEHIKATGIMQTKKFLNPCAELYRVNQFGQIIRPLTNNSFHDSGAVASPNGRWILFLSMESGDPELWVFEMITLGESLWLHMKDDSDFWRIKSVKRLTHRLGYEFGASFSRDSRRIVFAAAVINGSDEVGTYKKLLSENYVNLTLTTELFYMELLEDTNWSEPRQITHLNARSADPIYLSDDSLILFTCAGCATAGTSNNNGTHLYLIKEDGSGLEQVTFNESGFDAFPTLNSDGTLLAWSSNRNNGLNNTLDVNVFIARIHI
ncbi:WD40-like beta propeller repeat domain-containing protein [Ditylenchus destructor]|uniref:WD40-like beta propeller repeat domain-containing protein n=1 Tax=Ditylenchus destructor TaxID=166010 RepID=A0AAD4MUF7_9BILA|nr:WD40-like beta propeller repeat domain-containing protein [Ditylenchus destructor]